MELKTDPLIVKSLEGRPSVILSKSVTEIGSFP